MSEQKELNLHTNEPLKSIDGYDFTEDQKQLIRSQIAPEATNDELKLFLYVANKRRLDPLLKQIYAVHRKVDNVKKMTIQTSIDGFRIIAQRSELYAGQSEPQFIFEDILGKTVLSCAKITIFKFNPKTFERYPAAVGVAYFKEYNAGGPMWSRMPFNQLAKCAEAQGLRKCFPEDLSDLYISEEMNQADNVPGAALPDAPIQQNIIDEELKKAIALIDNATSIEELNTFKNNMPPFILAQTFFQQSSQRKFSELSKDTDVKGLEKNISKEINTDEEVEY